MVCVFAMEGKPLSRDLHSDCGFSEANAKVRLTISISTMKSNLNNVLGKCDRLIDYLPNNVSFFIVSQNENFNSNESVSGRIKLVRSTDTGLSKSRNLILDSVERGWLWIQDDDFELDLDEVFDLALLITNCDSDAVFVKVKSLESPDKFYKDYSFFNKHSILNSFKLSSIQIVLNRNAQSLINGLRFDERFGLGSSQPCGEECKFLFELFCNTNSVFYSDIAPSFHTTKIENRNISHLDNMYARGALLSEIPAKYGLPLLLYWMMRRFPCVSARDRVKMLAAGFFHGPA